VGRTRAAHLAPGAHASHEADEVQDVSQGDPGSDFGKVNAGHGGGSQGESEEVGVWGSDELGPALGTEKRNPYQSPRGLKQEP